MGANKTMTGYPSIDKPWLKYYKDDLLEKARTTPKDKSIFRFYAENVFIDPKFPVIKYFNAEFTAQQFLEMIDAWAGAFRAVGVSEDEMVPVYGTWCPEIAAIFFALNKIGAYPYFEKLDISEEALRAETAGAKVGVIFEPLWNETVNRVFTEDRFEKVFIIRLTDSMRFPLKQLVKLKRNSSAGDNGTRKDRFVYSEQIKELASSYVGALEAPFKRGRIALITTSSGTTGSVVKGIMDTNEGALANVLCTAYSEPGYLPGKECLITLPPTASTAINCFFLLPLYMGMTVRIDPRADEETWPRLLLKYKPSLSCSTGSMWLSYCRRITDMKKRGKRVDMSFSDTCIMGGSGVTPEQLDYINRTLRECNAKHALDSGYGCSEYFGVMTVDKHDVDHYSSNKNVIDVGIPIPGTSLGVFDDNGSELKTGQRGEIRVKGDPIMHGYFGKPELTQKMFDDGWLLTGDIGELDEDGYLYVYGRKNDAISVNGKTVFLFDVANELRTRFDLEDCMAEVKSLADGKRSVVIYYVQKTEKRVEEKKICSNMNAFAAQMGILVDGYREFETAFLISQTTLKPKNRYNDGFFNYTNDGVKTELQYQKDGSGQLTMNRRPVDKYAEGNASRRKKNV